nr:cytochrome P450 3045C5-2 [Brachionus rubens]
MNSLDLTLIKELLREYKLNGKLDGVTILKILGTSVIGLGVTYFIKIWSSYRFFKQRGIPTVDYKFFYGNSPEIFKNKNYSDQLKAWGQKYGKTYGYFEGHLPILVTSDLEIIQEVFIKQHTNFSARKRLLISPDDDHPSMNLFSSSKLRWKKMRNVMNPTFSSVKLRELGPDLIKCTDRFIEILESEQNKKINVTEYLKRFTMDSIWNCAFGIDPNIQFDLDNEYYYKCESVFLKQHNLGLVELTGVYFHELKTKIFSLLSFVNKFMSKFIDLSSRYPMFWFLNRVMEIVEKRKLDGVKKKDYLQLLIDSEADYSKEDKSEVVDYSSVHLEKKLTVDEIKQNLMLFMFAGYETTSNTLGYCFHVLAKYQDEQKRLYDEIRSVFDSEADNQINTDSVQKIEYLDMFIKEVLRYYTIGNIGVARRCTKRTTIKGIDIPVDSVIAVDVLNLHYDPEHWGPVDPNHFYPSRFSKEFKRNPLAFMGFGNGPRNCIGMKFAMIELKIALCKFMLKYEILPLDESEKNLELVETVVRVPKSGVKVSFKKRAD